MNYDYKKPQVQIGGQTWATSLTCVNKSAFEPQIIKTLVTKGGNLWSDSHTIPIVYITNEVML